MSMKMMVGGLDQTRALRRARGALVLCSLCSASGQPRYRLSRRAAAVAAVRLLRMSMCVYIYTVYGVYLWLCSGDRCWCFARLGSMKENEAYQ